MQKRLTHLLLESLPKNAILRPVEPRTQTTQNIVFWLGTWLPSFPDAK